MPLHYSKGIIQEHLAVRKEVGLFDVSHMGRIAIVGRDAEPFLDTLSTNRIAGKADHSTTYTVFTNAQGGSVDDLIVYKKDATHFFIVANASNREKDLAHLQKESKRFQVDLHTCYRDEGILALQGPRAMELAQKVIPAVAELTHHHFLETEYQGKQLIVAGTGYTGEKGCEFFVPVETLVPLWEALLAAGAEPVGLGARDSLRLEMGYALYGHELSDTISPTESVAAWTVKAEGRDFLGKENLTTQRHAYGVRLLDKGIAREGYEVWKEGIKIGVVTSGGYSPTLNRAIALILVQQPLKMGENVFISIRSNLVKAEIVNLPFQRS